MNLFQDASSSSSSNITLIFDSGVSLFFKFSGMGKCPSTCQFKLAFKVSIFHNAVRYG